MEKELLNFYHTCQNNKVFDGQSKPEILALLRHKANLLSNFDDFSATKYWIRAFIRRNNLNVTGFD